MATTCATVLGLSGASLSSTSSRLSSGFVKPPVIARNPLRQAMAMGNGARVTCFQRDWLRTDYNVIGFGLIGWLGPSSIPAINGKSLTSLFFDSIGAELAHFPTPPALTSQFWLVISSLLFFFHSPLYAASTTTTTNNNNNKSKMRNDGVEGLEELDLLRLSL